MGREVKYVRGSEWNKWDLHVHTPESDGYSGTWEQFRIQLETAHCDVIGLNDYFSVAGYKKVKEEIESGEINIGDKLILPIVEMRMTDSIQNKNTQTGGVTHFNFHIIFSNKIDVEEIELFIKSLECEDTTIGTDYNDKTKLKVKKVSFEETIKKLNSNTKFKDKFLIWLPYDEYGGIDEINPESDGWIKINFIKKSHILGSSRQKQIDFFLWISDLKQDGITPKFTQDDFKGWFEYKKPCIKGSDSHSATYPIGKLRNERSEPIDKYCWIKADLTFEGLKQIVYEPEDRIKIQELKPEEKEDYQLINKVKFIDASFTPQEILINQNLTTIIGGKSTGKSILLRNIAQTIDENEVNNRLEEVGLKPYSRDVSDFSIVWKDTQENRKNDGEDVNKKIIYIPQSYLNRLVDKTEDKTSIDQIIQNVLEQEDEIKKAFIDFDITNRKIEKALTHNIDELFHKRKDIISLQENIKSIGDKKGIEIEIEKLNKEILEYKKTSGLSEKELAEYDGLIKNYKQLKDKQESFINDLKNLDEIKRKEITVDPFLDDLSDDLKSVLLEQFITLKVKYQQKWIKTLDEQIDTLKKSHVANTHEINEVQQELDPLMKKVNESKALDEKIKKLNEQEEKYKKIVIEEKKQQRLIGEHKNLIENILENHSLFYDNLFTARAEILKQKSITGAQDLEFGIDIIFENISFNENFIIDVCNLKHVSQFEEGLLYDYKRSDNANFKDDIKKVIRGILTKTLILKNSYTKKEALTRLLQNWFTFDYRIKQNGDEISDMSPGKKSFVLLKLLIELDNSKCPILLDQPEDDLDNRSIYHDLVKFIKTKKKERQIIIATHNPNLVVGADSECIIVANQDGDESKNETYKFEYVQGSLENTFMDTDEEKVLYKQGIQEHVCDILEGGKTAFEQRKKKYNF